MLDTKELRQLAAVGVKAEITRLQAVLTELEVQPTPLPRRPVNGNTTADDKPRKRRQMSAAARKRISVMMKKRWAERRRG